MCSSLHVNSCLNTQETFKPTVETELHINILITVFTEFILGTHFLFLAVFNNH